MRKDNPNIRALKLLHSFCPSYFPLLAVKTLFNKLTPYFNLYMSAEVVNEIVGARDKDRLILLVVITVFGNFAIAIIEGILNRIFGHKETILNQRETAYFNRKTLTLDYADLENTEVRQLRRKITESANINWHGKQLLMMSVSCLVDTTISALLSLILGTEMFVLIFAAGFSWYAVLFAAILIAAVVFNIRYNFRIKDVLSRNSYETSQTMIDENRIDDAVDCYNMGKDVRLYRQDKLIMKIKLYCFDLHKKAFRGLFSSKFRINIPLSIAGTILKIVIHIFICVCAVAGVFGIGSIIKYVEFVEIIIGCIISYFAVYSDIKNNTKFVEDYLAYFDIPQKMYQGKIPVEKWFMCKGGDNEYEIEFRNVSFKYPSADFYALKNVSMKFKVGQKLAVVGMNGSGKTTFIKLLCRLYDPTEGEILLNGVNIKKYDYDDYLSLFSVVFQDFKLFSFPLGQNVAASALCDTAKAISCLEKAGFGGRLNSMPDGINTCLYKDFEETGVEISGGEAQKIALARALYKDAPFIVLDEPTAALDPIVEFEIYSKFNDIVEDKTAVYISHRLSSCRFCDSIAVFDNGRIIQRGSHDELVADESGKYRELWFAQAQYYTDTQNVQRS
ncbi:MAG: ABC transporter ATP-binding protein [Ruminococcaceae bacterium]|nr:ABC transporter ATP-binding protein [Oscillospiraceae bacterium]